MMTFGHSTFENLSIHVPKETLQEIVADVFELSFRIFWGFERGKMILHIYNSNFTNKLMFIRHKGYLELVSANLACDEIKDLLDKEIHLTSQAKQQGRQLYEDHKETREEMIDKHLLDLHQYLMKKDKPNIEKTKAILTLLVNS